MLSYFCFTYSLNYHFLCHDTRSLSLPRTHAGTQAGAQLCTHTRTHACTHTRTHAHTHTLKSGGFGNRPCCNTNHAFIQLRDPSLRLPLPLFNTLLTAQTGNWCGASKSNSQQKSSQPEIGARLCGTGPMLQGLREETGPKMSRCIKVCVFCVFLQNTVVHCVFCFTPCECVSGCWHDVTLQCPLDGWIQPRLCCSFFLTAVAQVEYWRVSNTHAHRCTPAHRTKIIVSDLSKLGHNILCSCFPSATRVGL